MVPVRRILGLLLLMLGAGLPGGGTGAAGWAGAGSLAGQVLRGRVTEDASGRMLAGAEVVVLDLDGVPILRSLSDTSGRFVLSLGHAGWYRVRVSHLGYADFTSDGIRIPEDDDVTLHVRMGSEAIPLEPLLVVGRRSTEVVLLEEFNHRRLNPGRVGGYFMTREQMDRRPMALPTQLLSTVPGIALQRAPGFTGQSYIRMRSGCNPAIYIDRVLVQQNVGGTLDDLLVADQIAGIEVYPRGAGAPVEYQRPNGCGVILFWTRRPEGGHAMPGLVRWIGGTALVVGIFAAMFSAMLSGG